MLIAPIVHSHRKMLHEAWMFLKVKKISQLASIRNPITAPYAQA